MRVVVVVVVVVKVVVVMVVVVIVLACYAFTIVDDIIHSIIEITWRVYVVWGYVYVSVAVVVETRFF